MINKNLPEPREEDRYCVYCGKRKRLRGTLIHWPDEDYDNRHNGDDRIRLPGHGAYEHSFSIWTYTCAWCRGIDKKRKARLNALLESYPATKAIVEAVGI